MWLVTTEDEFDTWFDSLSEAAQESVLAAIQALKECGPMTGRPLVDTVKGSKFPNMKELIIQYKGAPLRVFFAFNPSRNAVMLCGGNKQGKKRFYVDMIRLADAVLERHLQKQAG